MSRISIKTKQDLPKELRPLWEKMQSYGAFENQAGVMAHRPPIFRNTWKMLTELAEEGVLGKRHLELCLVTVSLLNKCTYCVSHHAPKLAVQGVSEAGAERLLDYKDHPELDEVDKLVVEYADQPGRMEPDLVEWSAADGGKPGRGLHAGNVGRDEIGARGTAHMGGRERRRPQAGGGVDDAAGMRVVEVEAVHQDAVEECGIARGQAQRQADYGDAALPAEARDGGRRLVGELVTAGGERDAGGVQHQMLGPLAHLGWNRLGSQVMGKVRQRLGDELRFRLGIRRLVHGAQHYVHGGPPSRACCSRQ